MTRQCLIPIGLTATSGNRGGQRIKELTIVFEASEFERSLLAFLERFETPSQHAQRFRLGDNKSELSTPSLANASEDEMLKAAIAASLREAESVHASKKPKSVTAISSDEEDWGEEDDYESDNGDDFVAIDEESDDDSAWSKPEESKSNNIITARPEPAADISDAVTVCLVFPDGSR
eukprot:m.194040 g.194040  ORF g.194040 m.194040 type:complete len:177 (+) comp16787_c6_seq2:553-1083(+)